MIALWERAAWSYVVVGPTQAPRRSRRSLVRFSTGRRRTCRSSVCPSARLAPRERTRRRASLRAPAASIDLSTATIARPWQTIFFRAARPTSPRRSPASQAASWQTAGIARGSGKRDSQSDTSVSPRRFRSDADVITSRRLKTRWETRAPWTGAIVIPAIRRRARIGGQRYASDFCCALPRTAARRSKAATGAATASTCSLQLGLACGCSGAASRRRGRIYRSTREDSTTNGPRQQTRPRRVVVSNAADYKICGCGDALLSDCFLLR